MVVTKVLVTGFQGFEQFIQKIDENGAPIYFYFSGQKLSNGNSWCPDCVESEPIVNTYLNDLNKEVIFAYVDVGDRDAWRDKNCPFRTDTRTKLMVIPTIIKWKGVQRLEGSQCTKRELLQMLFEEEE